MIHLNLFTFGHPNVNLIPIGVVRGGIALVTFGLVRTLTPVALFSMRCEDDVWFPIGVHIPEGPPTTNDEDP